MPIFQKLYITVFFCFIFSQVHAETDSLRVAVTTTTANSGLMPELNSAFENKNNVKVNVIITGSGQALQLGKAGDVDVLLTHSPEDEVKFIDSGYGLKRYPVMHNDFVLVGPMDDPANVKQANSISDAFEKISTSKSLFISRGDESGTHKKELAIWNNSELEPKDDWYIQAAMGMGSVLLIANERQAYTLADRGTYLAFKERINLEIHYQGDVSLHNPYHVISVNPDRHKNVNYDLAKKYIEFLTGEEAQKIINDFKFNGAVLFHPERFVKEGSIKSNNSSDNKSFFLDAIVSSINLILGFDKTLFLVVWTSLKVSLIAVLFAVLFGLPLGVIVALNTFRGKNFLLACLNTLMALPTVVVGLLLYGLLNRQGVFGDFGLLYTPTAMVIGQCALIIPIIWNLSISAVNSADPRLARTCTSLGANYIQRSIIYMSEVRFALVAAVVTGFGRAIGEVGIAMMLGGNISGFTRTMTTAIALETSKGEFEFALALGFMLLLVAFVVNAILQQFQLKIK